MSDVFWRVDGDDPWPDFGIDEEELISALDQFSEYWDDAVQSLAQTVIPQEVAER